MSTPTFDFYTENRLDDTCTYSFTSANTSFSSYLYDRVRSTRLTSVGSNDATPEVWEITFAATKTISAIMLDNHNIKSGTIQYWNGSSYVNFSTAISLSNNTDTTNFFTFNQVSTTQIKLTLNTTQTVDAQKTVGEVMAIDYIGTPETLPSAFSVTYTERSVEHETATGGSVYVFFGKKAKIKITFSDASYTDMSLFETLKNLFSPFIIYPNGGAFAGQDIGFRIYDIFTVNYVNDFTPVLKANVLGVRQSLAMELREI